ncbi:MAG: hypothetical protein FWC43_01450 [Planctomycetaceae bacterium]|nr:hypothetical protein [Planctomycetaceae bacterium]
MFRYSGPLLSFVVIAVCLGINVVRYPIVWEMVDQTAFRVSFATQEAVESFEHQVVQTETEQKADSFQEGSPVPPPLGGSPSSLPSSTRTLFTTNLSKSPPENVSTSGYGPIPAHLVPNHKIAVQAAPQEVEEPELFVASESDWTEEDEDLSDYQPFSPRPAYAAHYEERLPESNKTPFPVSESVESESYEYSRELTPEEKVEAFKNSPLDLTPAADSRNKFRETPDW